MNSWKYYNNALMPNCPPHESHEISVSDQNSIWSMSSRAIMARYTSEFDCKRKTDWWFIIKDTPFDITTLRAKRRYVINKGLRFFDVKEINPLLYKEELLCVQQEAFSAYPIKYRPKVNRDSFYSMLETIHSQNEKKVFAAFYKETNELCGYVVIAVFDSYTEYQIHKTMPRFERLEVNAALVYGVLNYMKDLIKDGYYICDGSRAILHETAFQDYLEKYFGFRKAYCTLHVIFNPKYRIIITVLYRFRKLFKRMDSIGFIHKMNAVFLMKEIADSM